MVFLPLGAYGFVERQPAQGFEAFGVVVGQQKGLQVSANSAVVW